VINLGKNNIKADGADRFADAIRENFTIQKIVLGRIRANEIRAKVNE
jgi:hypothetical protein